MSVIRIVDRAFEADNDFSISIEKLRNERFCVYFSNNCRLISKDEIIQVIEQLKDLIK